MVFYALEFVSERERGEVISVPRPLFIVALFAGNLNILNCFEARQSSKVRDVGMLAVRGDEQ